MNKQKVYILSRPSYRFVQHQKGSTRMKRKGRENGGEIAKYS